MMPWLLPSWTELKKKVLRYLLNRYLGQFLEEKLTLDQLSVDFFKGTGTVKDVTLQSQSLNELCENQGWNIEVVGGRVGSIQVSVPWNAIMSEDSHFEVSNLCITLRPLCRSKDGTSVLESMWSSMSSSMQLAQDCIDNEDLELGSIIQESNAMEGLERVAQTIDNVLNRIKARLTDTEIRLEYVTPGSSKGVVLTIKIKTLQYRNEAGSDKPEEPATEKGDDDKSVFTISTYSTHHVKMDGITFYTEEFRIEHSNTKRKEKEKPTGMSEEASEQFYSTISELPEVKLNYSNDGTDIESDSQSECSSDCDDDDSQTSSINITEPILLGQLTGTQELRIQMKQTENVPGPMVQLELTLGALNFFLSPRQLQLLIMFGEIFLNDAQSSSSENSQRMYGDLADEIDLKQNLHKLNEMASGIGLRQGWSNDPLVDSNLTNVLINHLPMGHQHSQHHHHHHQRHYGGGDPSRLVDSTFSSNTSMTSSMTSSMTVSTQNTAHARKRGVIDADPNADISKLNIRVSSCLIVLLHEDVLVESLDGCPLSDQSVLRLKELSDNYFATIETLGPSYGVNDLLNAGKLLDTACSSNHLRLLLTPIIIGGEEQRNASGNLLRLTASIPRADFREVLSDESVPLVEFIREDALGLPESPEVTINIKQITHTLRGSGGKRLETPKTEISFSLAPCTTDIDISIIDRLHALFNASPYTRPTVIGSYSGAATKTNKLNVKVDCQALDVRLRFPIADLRPIHDPGRLPWWKRNVRPDFLLFNFIQMRFIFTLPATYVLETNELNLFYCENVNSERIHMARASLVEKPVSKFAAPTIEYPRISVELPSECPQPECRSSDDSDGGTGHENIGFTRPKEQTPFSSKRVCRESDTPHSKQASEETETLLIPGDKTEMDNFCEDAMRSSKIQIKVSLPVISLQLKSKHLYEVLYNRINSDLLLWEPSAPKSPKPTPTPIIENPLLNAGMMDSIYEQSYSMCKSGIDFESSSPTNSDSDGDSDSVVYHSVYENKRLKRSVSRTIAADQTNAVSFQLSINQGIVTMYSPVRDSQSHVIPGQLGEFVIKCNSAVVFSTNGYHGNENLGYVCLQVKSAELYHFGLIPVPSTNPPLRSINCVLPSHLNGTLYPTPKGISMCTAKGATNREMIGLALQLKSFPDQRIKKIKVAAGIQKTTLRHFTTLQEHMWLTQLIDMFDVTDDPVLGYQPMGVVTEMHLHLWDSAIDYRPLHFTHRSIITVGTFILSSNITTASSGLTLRFIAEDATMSLAPQKRLEPTDVKPKSNNVISMLPASELVCVLDLELFEISLRLNDKPTASFPKLDLRTTINGVYLRTCSDSAEALAQFINYLANEGDLVGPNDESDENEMPSDEELLSTKAAPTRPRQEITATQHERIKTLMEEAMQESVQLVPEIPDDGGDDDQDDSIFYFPDQYPKSERDNDSQSKSSTPTLRRSISLSESQRSFEMDGGPACRGACHTQSEDSVSMTSETKELDFDNSMLGLKTAMETEVTEALPQVATDLGNISRPHPVKTAPRRVSSDTEDGFCIIAHEEKPRCRYEEVQTTAEPIQIVDSHFNPPGKPDLLKAPDHFPMAVVRYTICEMTVTWQLFGGHDFPKCSDKQLPPKSQSTAKARQKMSEAYKMGVSYSKGSPSVSFGSGTSGSHRKLTWKERGGTNRRHDVLIEFYISKVRLSYEKYPPHTKQASRQVLLVTELEIRDRLSISQFNKFLYHKRTGSQSKKNTKHVLVVNAVHLRPDRSLARQECDLNISILPLHLHIDQDSLIFLVDFFSAIGSTSGNEEVSVKSQPARRHSSPLHEQPVMMVDVDDPVSLLQEHQARQMVSDNLMWLMNEDEVEPEVPENATYVDDDASPIFFRKICFHEVSISFDYKGKRVQLSHGPLTGLIMGLGQLQCTEIRLKAIHYKKGILGMNKLVKLFQDEWLDDIRNNQLASLLKGLGPMNTLIELLQGIFDLFWMPIEQFKKDGRIIRGLQLGCQSFTARTALAALEITTRLIQLLQITAETAYDMVSPGPSVRRIRCKPNRKRLHPPQDIREGVSNALIIVKEGFGDTAHTIVEVAALEHDQKGYTGAVGAVIRQIPPTVVKPIVLATQATTNVLGGVRNQLVPDARRDAKEKWKDDED